LADKPSEFHDPLNSIGYLSRVNFRAFSSELEKLTEAHGVSAGQWRFLRVLWEEDGLTQRELSRRVGITEPTAVKGVASLEAAGLVTREIDKSDKRKMLVSLTPKARRLKRKLMPMVVAVNERALHGIDAGDIETARRVLKLTLKNLTGDQEA